MKWIPQFSVRNPFLLHMTVILVVLLGITAYVKTPKEFLPPIPGGSVVVTVRYPGTSPEEMEKLIAIPIEQQVNHVDGVKHIRSTAKEGYASVEAVIETTEDITKVRQDIQAEVLKAQLPEEAEDPEFQERRHRSWQFIQLALYGNVDERYMNNVADVIRDELETIDGVSRVGVSGRREEEIHVLPDPMKLEAYRVTIDDISNAIRTRHLNVTGGTAKMEQTEHIVRVKGELHPGKLVDGIKKLVVREGGGGSNLLIGDLAEVKEDYEEETVRKRVQGAPGIIFSVFKTDHGDIMNITDRVYQIVAEKNGEFPADMKLIHFADNSLIIRDRLTYLLYNGISGFAIVLLCLIIFLDFRVALFTVHGLIVAIGGTFICMNIFDISVSAISTMSLIIILGIGVDDGIVVGENIYRHMLMGKSRTAAAIDGTTEVFWSVVGATGTTIAAFIPLLLIPDISKGWGDVALVVIIALLWSTYEVFFIMPGHMAHFGKVPKKRRSDSPSSVNVPFTILRNSYLATLRFLLRMRYAVVAVVIVAIVGSINLLTTMKFMYINVPDVAAFGLIIQMPEGTKLDKTEEIVRQVERKVLEYQKEKGEIGVVISEIGVASRKWGGQAGAHWGQIECDLVHFDQRKQFWKQTRKELVERIGAIPGAVIEPHAWEGISAWGFPIEVRVRGDNLATLETIAVDIRKFVESHPGGKGGFQGFLNYNKGKQEFVIVPDEEKAKLHNVSVQTVGRAIHQALTGDIAAKIKGGREEVDVRVKYPDAWRAGTRQVPDIRIRTNDGAFIPLNAIARFESDRGVESVNRYDLQRTISYTVSNIDTTKTEMTSKDINGAIKERFKDIEKQHPGYSIEYGGEEELREETLMGYYKAFAIGTLLVYMVIGSIFKSFLQPLVILTAVPLALIGGVLGLQFMNEPVTLTALIGFMTLLGISVNDSIVYIEFINGRRQEGRDRWGSIMDAATIRFLPIFLTSVTTIGSMLSLALLRTGATAFVSPIAIVIVFGMLTETVLTLLVIPCFTAILDDFFAFCKRNNSGANHEESEMKGDRAKVVVIP